MEKRNEYKVCTVLWSIASIFEFISAIFGFIAKNVMTYSSLALGICFLCFAIMYFNKYKKDKEKDSKK